MTNDEFDNKIKGTVIRIIQMLKQENEEMKAKIEGLYSRITELETPDLFWNEEGESFGNENDVIKDALKSVGHEGIYNMHRVKVMCGSSLQYRAHFAWKDKFGDVKSRLIEDENSYHNAKMIMEKEGLENQNE